MPSTPFTATDSAKKFVTYERVVFILSLLCIMLGVGMIYLRLFPEIMNQAFIPLHYNVYSGTDSYGPWWRIFTIPGFGLTFFVANMLVARFAIRKNPLLHAFLYGITLFTQIILFIALLFVIALNISLYG